MRMLLMALFSCSIIISAQNQVVSTNTKNALNYDSTYRAQVFTVNITNSTSPTFLYCKEKSKNHKYQWPWRIHSHLRGYKFTGYDAEEQENVDFSSFKESFERYCYLPCDGLTLFYNQHPMLKKTLSYIPFLNVLIPYWIKGDVVQEIAVDILTRWLKAEDSTVTNMFPDIPINILWSPNDPLVTKEMALILCHQLTNVDQFKDIRLKRVDSVNEVVAESYEPNNVQFKNTVKLYENRQWWLKNLWVSKLGLIVILAPIVMKLAMRYQSNTIWFLGCFIFEEIVRR